VNDTVLSHQEAPDILVVDDTPANLELLFGMLKDSRYKIRAAISGELALQAARNDPPDLVLLDITMPVMDGYEVCRRLKADEKLKDIPVIFLSALNEPMDKVKAFGIGGADYITKPFQLEEVRVRMETQIELRRQKHALQESYDKLRELEEMRDDLTHLIIHDLRTPLTCIRGYLELIEKHANNSPLERERRLHRGSEGSHRADDPAGLRCPGHEQDGSGADEVEPRGM
jgi:two-component system sensor histidine kinase/response regulator